MTPSHKVRDTREWLRKDTGDSTDEQHDEGGEACDYSVAARLQSECLPPRHEDRESYDNQEVPLETPVAGGDATDQVEESRGLGEGNTPVHVPPPELPPLGKSYVLSHPPGAPLEEATLMTDEHY